MALGNAYQISSTGLGNLVTLASLSVPDPKSDFRKYTQGIPLTSGGKRGAGYPMCVWRWSFLTQAQRDALRAYCTGASNSVHIETRTVDSSDVWDQFAAEMFWPEEEERDGLFRIEFAIEFRFLVEA